ncbi:hypothetical protein PR202_ga23072 [Eleusine coracana subsp. coracana]|uniref:Uncharacterized protein n=1 Tax=Eleusine coracana subsp. coracana TaxID=191504 RepID=A0AAV5D4V0_ELECO|nr:hypothetical protein QOZ80_1AG0014290 [Eleusine coracana subsp. coracana]GJN05446.1 hypothetical protein PR202_ga23072 [Eleusine coracana subsp. coracana]
MSVPGVASPAADRFYCPPPRRHLLNKQKQQQRNLSPTVEAAPEEPERPTSELRRDTPPSPPAAATNLDSFIASTAVRVPSRRLPRTSARGTGTGAAYYELADLWEAFGEWSAYGAGVPLLLNGTVSVVQYYVPFLSAIQLYRPLPSSKRQLGEDSDDDSAPDTTSESDNERSSGMTTRGSADICSHEEGFSSDDSESGNQLSPVFQYMEHDAPYGRQPLADMISVFSSKFPDLNTYRSCDLLPSSWISVAWYPIYRIPTGPTLQDLDACFLTFHSLSTPFGGMLNGPPETNNFHDNKIADVPGKITLPLIGLASYKLNGSMWMSNQHHEQQLTTSLLKAADDWLCQRQVDHPDYRFFLSH